MEKTAFAAKKCKFCEEVKNCLQQILQTATDAIARLHTLGPGDTIAGRIIFNQNKRTYQGYGHAPNTGLTSHPENN